MIVPLNRKLARHQRGAFTLLEVLVVVAIIVILAGVAGVSFFKYLEDARADAAATQCDIFEKACKNYMVKNGGDAPPNLQVLVAPTEQGQKPFVEGGIGALNTPFGGGRVYQYNGENFDEYGQRDPIVTAEGPNGLIYSPRRQRNNGK